MVKSLICEPAYNVASISSINKTPPLYAVPNFSFNLVNEIIAAKI